MTGVGSSERPVFTHTVSDDGLSLVSTATTSAGTYSSTVGWADLVTAQAHYEAARIAFEAKSGALSIGPGERRWARIFRGRVVTTAVVVFAGPPTWWWPNVGAGRLKRMEGRGVFVRGGWLRLAVEVAFSRGVREGA